MDSIGHATSVGSAHREGRATVVTRDGTRLFVRDWGTGQPVVFMAAWAFTSDVWGAHIDALVAAGLRCIAYDRRGHGRSDDPGRGYDADTLADDLADLLDALDLRDATLVAYSMASLEAVRYLARHGSGRVAKLVLLAPTTPFLARSADNPDGIPADAFDLVRGTMVADFPKWLSDNEAPFFTPETSRETRDWIRGVMLTTALPVLLACHRTLTGTDSRDDLRTLTVPTLVIQGDCDASAPLSLTGARTAPLIPDARLKVYEGAPHALPLTHRERFLDDLRRFIGG